MSVEKLIAEIRELDRDTVPVKATFESGLPPEEFLYLKRNHILTLCRIIEVMEISIKEIKRLCDQHIPNSGHLYLNTINLIEKDCRIALAESDRIAAGGKE